MGRGIFIVRQIISPQQTFKTKKKNSTFLFRQPQYNPWIMYVNGICGPQDNDMPCFLKDGSTFLLAVAIHRHLAQNNAFFEVLSTYGKINCTHWHKHKCIKNMGADKSMEVRPSALFEIMKDRRRTIQTNQKTDIRVQREVTLPIIWYVQTKSSTFLACHPSIWFLDS